MATLTPKDLLAMWTNEQLPLEMATGQILQHLVAMHASLEGFRQLLGALQSQVTALTAPTELPKSRPRGRPRRTRAEG